MCGRSVVLGGSAAAASGGAEEVPWEQGAEGVAGESARLRGTQRGRRGLNGRAGGPVLPGKPGGRGPMATAGRRGTCGLLRAAWQAAGRGTCDGPALGLMARRGGRAWPTATAQGAGRRQGGGARESRGEVWEAGAWASVPVVLKDVAAGQWPWEGGMADDQWRRGAGAGRRGLAAPCGKLRGGGDSEARRGSVGAVEQVRAGRPRRPRPAVRAGARRSAGGLRRRAPRRRGNAG